MNKQLGGTLIGFVIGLLVGLGLALAVAVYVTKVPVPFVDRGVSRINQALEILRFERRIVAADHEPRAPRSTRERGMQSAGWPMSRHDVEQRMVADRPIVRLLYGARPERIRTAGPQ